MIITSIDELRRTFPAHAIDDIAPLVGVIDNSEHDFLLEKLGAPLYNKMCAYYDDHHHTCPSIDTEQTGYYDRLILICQRVVAYDAIGRAVGTHILSLNNAGVNIPTADDYGKVDLEAVRTFQKTCTREAHAAVNRLLQTLEEWCQQSGDTDTELAEITSLWHQSRYYYLAASLLIPSSVVLQDYWNTYDSREKFIQMLPDLRYIQEEVIAPSIGEEFTEALVAINRDTVQTKTSAPDAAQQALAEKTVEKLRKAMAAMLEERTLVIATDKLRRQQAHDEAVRLLQSAITFIQSHQEDYTPVSLYNALACSPLYDPAKHEPAPATAEEATDHPTPPHHCRRFENNRRNSAMFVTPFLN